MLECVAVRQVSESEASGGRQRTVTRTSAAAGTRLVPIASLSSPAARSPRLACSATTTSSSFRVPAWLAATAAFAAACCPTLACTLVAADV